MNNYFSLTSTSQVEKFSRVPSSNHQLSRQSSIVSPAADAQLSMVNDHAYQQKHYQLLFLPHNEDSSSNPAEVTSTNPNLLLSILSKVLERLIDINTKAQPYADTEAITKFHSSYKPDVTIYSYMERIRKYANCHDSCFLVALIYIDRLIVSQNFVLSNLNVHRLFITW
jgi:hypothetical protein